MNRRRSESDNGATESPHHMGHWTVTMLRDELRIRQLPTSGSKAELLDRLASSSSSLSLSKSPTMKSNLSHRSRPRSALAAEEERSPSKQPGAKKSLTPRSLTQSLQKQIIIESSPKSKGFLEGFTDVRRNPFLDTPTQRGRSRVRRTFAVGGSRMLTRSRSQLMIQGTHLQWISDPYTIIANAFMYAVEECTKQVRNHPLLVLTVVSLLALSVTFASLDESGPIVKSFAEAAVPFYGLFTCGIAEALGFGGSVQISLFNLAGSSIVLLRQLGVEEYVKHGPYRLSNSYSLWTAMACQILAYNAGSLVGSFAMFWLASQCRHNAFFVTNTGFRRMMRFASNNFGIISALPNIFFGLDTAGLIAGFAGYDHTQFWSDVLFGRALVGISMRLASSSFFLDDSSTVFELLLMRIGFLVPSAKVPINALVELYQFARQSVWLTRAWEYGHYAALVYLITCAIKATANRRVYNRFRFRRSRL